MWLLAWLGSAGRMPVWLELARMLQLGSAGDGAGAEAGAGKASLCVGYVNVIALIFMSLFLAKLIILP